MLAPGVSDPWKAVVICTAQTNHETGEWTKNAIDTGDISPPDLYAPRGKLAAADWGNVLIALLPDEPALELRIYASTAAEEFTDWTLLAVVENSQSEPLFDKTRLTYEDVLSVFVRQGGPFPDRKLQVWDFKLEY